MKTFLSVFILLFSTLLTLNAQTAKSIQPINLGLLLLDEPSVEKMVETCQYYNLSKMDEEDGFRTFKHPSGAVVKFKINEIGDERVPLIEIVTKSNSNNIKKNLTELGFQNINGSEYFRGSKFTRRYSSCSILQGNPTTVIFTKKKTAENK